MSAFSVDALLKLDGAAIDTRAEERSLSATPPLSSAPATSVKGAPMLHAMPPQWPCFDPRLATLMYPYLVGARLARPSTSSDALTPSAGAESSHKRKGGQIRFSNEQTDALERKFDRHKYLSPNERKRLARTLQLSERQVKTWFQNRRAKWRRIRKDGDDACYEDHSGTMNSNMYEVPTSASSHAPPEGGSSMQQALLSTLMHAAASLAQR